MTWNLKTTMLTDVKKSFHKEWLKELMCNGPKDISMHFLCDMMTNAINGLPYYIYDRHLAMKNKDDIVYDMEHTVHLCQMFGLKCEVIDETGHMIISWEDYRLWNDMEEIADNFNKIHADHRN